MRAPVLEIRPLAPFGAEVRGLDLREAQPVETQAILRAALTEHALLFLRDQDLARDDLFRFATMFGNISDQGEAAGGYNYVSNVNAPGINAAGEVTLTTGNGELEFHLDHCFQESPLKAIVLHAIEVPNEGGDTLFTDMRAITRRLPPALVAQLKGRTIRHRSPTRTGNPEATHPVMLEHPVSGVPLLFFSKMHAMEIHGLSKEASDALIKELPTYIGRPETTLRHTWRPNDLVIWDNLVLQHARTNFDPAERRHLQRVQIGF